MTISKTIEIKWRIKDYPTYGVGVDKNLYNTKTGRQIKQVSNNSCIGYWLGKNFVSLSKLKTLLYIPKKEKLPF